MSTTVLQREKNGAGQTHAALTRGVPPLLNGDHLAVPEFERRYYAMPAIKKAELIEGIVVMPSPTRYLHAESHGIMNALLGRYALNSAALACADNASVRFDGKNEYQPDILLRIKSGKLAASKVAADGLIDGPPEFIAEIAVSSAGYNLHEKKTVYQRSLVQEYFVWQVMDSKIQWFALEKGEFVQLAPGKDGVICSRVFPGLCLDIQAILAGDAQKAQLTLEKGLKSPDYRAFLKRLNKKEAS